MNQRDIVFMWIGFAIVFFGIFSTSYTMNNKTLALINQNHTELLQLINTEKQAEVEFLESLKKAKSNRIKKGDELK